MSLHAELHRHLGGAVVPRIFWRYLHRTAHPLAERFPTYESFESFVTRPRSSLDEYLELHTMVESVQRPDTLAYFVSKLVRGAFVFESIAYMELRHSPFLRTDPTRPMAERLDAMREIVETIAAAAVQPEYPIIFSQILCMHSRLPYEVNLATVELAAAMPEQVCGVDLAGPDHLYAERLREFIDLFARAKALGLRTTGHIYETPAGCHPEVLPYLDRIGHGVQIPLRLPELLPQLAQRRQCLELCPTTYLKTGTLSDLAELQPVFEICERAGVDIAICTDNAGLHNVRLPFEYENLLTHDIIDFRQLRACQAAAFRHAFAWPYAHPPTVLWESLGQHDNAKSGPQGPEGSSEP